MKLRNMRQVDKIKKAIAKYPERVKYGYVIDAYNRLIVKDGIACTIHTRISAGNYWYVLVNDKRGNNNCKRQGEYEQR